MNVEAANDKLAAQLGLTETESARVGKVAGDLYAGAYGDSLATVNDAVKGVVQNIGMSVNDVNLQGITAKVLDVATAFDQDLGGTTRAVGQLMRTGLAKDANEALDIVTAGFQSGADKSEDFLDTLNEYGTQFRKLGIDGVTATGLISQGLQAGARDGDLVADAFKEFSIRAVDGSKTTIAAFEGIGLNAEKMGAAIAGGGPGAQQALGQVMKGLRSVKDPAEQAAYATMLFGTQAEDLGSALFALDPTTAAKGMGEVAGAADRMGATLNNNASTNIESFKRQLTQAFVETLGNRVLPAASAFAAFLATGFGPAFAALGSVLTNQIVPAFTSVVGLVTSNQTTFTVVAGVIAAVLIPAMVAMGISATTTAAAVVAAWVSQAAAATANAARMVVLMTAQGVGYVAMAASSVAAAASVAASWVAMGAQAMLGAARVAAAWLIAIGPIALVIAAVVAVVVAIVKNWDTIKAATKAAWDAIVGAVKAAWEAIKTAVSAAVNAVKAVITTVFEAVKVYVTTVFNVYKTIITTAWNAIKTVVTAAVGAVKTAITAGFDAVKAFIQTAMDGITGIIGKAWDLVVSGVTGLGGRITSAAAGIFNGLKEAFRGAVNFIIDAWNGLEFRIPGFDPPGPGPKFGGFTLGVPNIPRLADGGIVRAQPGGILANIGEGGRDEAVIPLTAGGLPGMGEVVAELRALREEVRRAPRETEMRRRTLALT